MKPIAIIDVETTGLDPEKDHIIEVAMALIHPEGGHLIEAWSGLVSGVTENPAADVNGIPPHLLASGRDYAMVCERVRKTIAGSECVVSHNTAFDSAWFPAPIQAASWICSCDEIDWPKKSSSKSLTAIALAHGLGVAHAHRALADVLLLARLFERAVEMGMSIPAVVARGLRPKARYVVAERGFDEARNAKVKAAGFHWDAAKKEWARTMAIEDADALPFAVKRAA